MAIFLGTIRNGSFQPDNPIWFSTLAKNNNKRMMIIIEPESKKRSLNQNSYYHGVVIKILADFSGNDPDDIHEFLRMKFLQEPIKNDMVTIKRTKHLTTIEFEKYMEDIRRWASMEYGCYIPLPGEAPCPL